MAKDTNIKFGVRAPRESPYSTFLETSRDPNIFGL